MKQNSVTVLEENEKLYEELKAVLLKLDAANVMDQATVTLSEVTTMYETLKSVVKKILASKKDHILISKSGNMSEEQLKEIQETFQHFDKDGDGELNQKEFNGCCQSLGQFTDDALDEAFAAACCNNSGDHSDKVTFDAYLEYMSKYLKVGGSYENVLEAFEELCDGSSDLITEDRLRSAIGPEEVEYLTKRMPKNEKGFDYGTYLRDIYGCE